MNEGEVQAFMGGLILSFIMTAVLSYWLKFPFFINLLVCVFTLLVVGCITDSTSENTAHNTNKDNEKNKVIDEKKGVVDENIRAQVIHELVDLLKMSVEITSLQYKSKKKDVLEKVKKNFESLSEVVLDDKNNQIR